MTKEGYLLLADDDSQFRTAFAEWLRERFPQWGIKEAPDSDTAWEIFTADPDRCRVVLIDYKLNGLDFEDGLDLMRAIRKESHTLPVLIITGQGDRQVAAQAVQEGAFWYLEKPLDIFTTELLIKQAHRLRPRRDRTEALRQHIDEIIHPDQMQLAFGLTEAQDFQSLANEVRKHLPSLSNAQAACLVRFDMETGSPIDKVVELDQPQPLRFERHYLHRSLSKELAERGSPHIVTNTELEPDINPQLLKAGIRAFGGCACPPIKGAPLVLYLYFERPLAEEKRLEFEAQLVTWSRLIGLSYEQLRQKELLGALAQTGQRLLKASTEEEVNNIVQEVLQEHFQVSTFYLARYDPQRKQITFPVAYDGGKKLDLDPISPEQPSLTSCIVEAKCALSWDSDKENFQWEETCSERHRSPSSPRQKCRPVIEGEQPAHYYGVPISLPTGHIVGALSIQRYFPRDFQPAVKLALKTLAAQVGQALYSLRSQQYERLLSEADQRFSRANSRADLLQATLTLIEKAWPSAIPSILENRISNEGEKEGFLFLDPSINHKYFDSVAPRYRHRLVFAYGEGIVGRVADTRQPYLCSDCQNEEEAGPYIPTIPTTRSEIGIPIFLGDRLLGVLDVESDQPGFFGEAEQHFLEQLARKLAIAWGAAGNKEFADAVLMAAARAARSEHPLKTLAEEVYRIARLYNPIGHTGPTMVAIFLKTDDHLEAVAAYPEDVLEGLQRKIGPLPLTPPHEERRGIVVRAALKRETQRVSDVALDPDYIKYHEDTQAELAVPILSPTGELVGVLNVEYAHTEDLTEEDEHLLQTLASQVHVISVLAEEAEARRREQQKHQVANTLALISLASLEQRHTLKTLSATLEGTLELLQGCFTRLYSRFWIRAFIGKCAREINNWLDRLQNTVQRLKKALKKELLEDQPAPHEELAPVSLPPLLKDIRQQVLELFPNVKIPPISSSEDVRVVANSAWLGHALKHLALNAARATCQKHTNPEEDHSPQVTLHVKAQDHTALIEIKDNGPGIPPEVRPYLFRTRIPKEHRQGAGLGSLIAAYILQVYNGTVKIQQTGEQGTIIQVALPLSEEE